ncbi:MAG TPA: hypothetical protein VK486_04375, partial [Thermoleophilaceae bacterium]|nr:hypothetical protein [Thermoleophilaceae bacterium]
RTDHFVASADLSPAPNAVPLRHYGRLPFYARLTSPTATYTMKTEGGWSVDPTDPYAPDASMCAFTPESETLDCEYNPISTRRLGGPFTLGLPDNGSYRLYYSLSNGTVRCPEGEIGARLLEAEAYGPPTKLRVGAVKGLRKGRGVSVSGTVDTVPGSPGVTGGETLDYTLNVKRLR